MNQLFKIILARCAARSETPAASCALYCLCDYLHNPDNLEHCLHRAAQHLWGSTPPLGWTVSTDWKYTRTLYPIASLKQGTVLIANQNFLLKASRKVHIERGRKFWITSSSVHMQQTGVINIAPYPSGRARYNFSLQDLNQVFDLVP